MGFLPYILLVLVPSIVLSLWATWRVRSNYSKWDKVDSGMRMSPFDFARYLLDRNGLQNVQIEPIPGNLTDHYDPRSKTLRVSSAVAGSQRLGRYDPTDAEPRAWPARAARHDVSRSPRQRSSPTRSVTRSRTRSATRPWRCASSSCRSPRSGPTIAPWLIIVGMFMQITDLAVVGLVFFAAAVAFTFITLPVEFGASKRALALCRAARAGR